MSRALIFHYLLLNMFRMLIHRSSGVCDLFVELFHGLYCSSAMCVGVTLWFGWSLHPDTTSLSHKLLGMDVLTSETCWAVNNEIIKQVTSRWSLFIQLAYFLLHNFSEIQVQTMTVNMKLVPYTYPRQHQEYAEVNKQVLSATKTKAISK